MAIKSLGQLEEHAFYLIFLGTIITLYWHAVWGILDRIEKHLETYHGLPKSYFHILSIILVVLIIGLFPEILQKF
jgi:hypothetical protein